MTNVGFVLGSTVNPADIASAARAAEESGFDSIWTTEDYFMTGGVSATGIALAATTRITVGLSLLSVYARHPALTAMEASTLAGAYPGRFVLGLGTGVFGWLDQMGLPHEAPLGTMRDSVRTIRALLAGKTVTEQTTFTFDNVHLDYPPLQAPAIHIGATGPKMTQLTGQVADGILLSVTCGQAFVANARAVIDANTPEGVPRRSVTALAIFSCADTIEKARAEVRPVLAAYLSAGPLSDAAGISEQLAEILERGGKEALAEEMPDAWIDMLAVCGDSQACAAAIDLLLDAGADSVALLPVSSHNLAARITDAATSIFALMKTR